MPILLMIISVIHSDGLWLVTSTVILVHELLIVINKLYSQQAHLASQANKQTDTPFRACSVPLVPYPIKLLETQLYVPA